MIISSIVEMRIATHVQVIIPASLYYNIVPLDGAQIMEWDETWSRADTNFRSN